jgi:hypothetical protein
MLKWLCFKVWIVHELNCITKCTCVCLPTPKSVIELILSVLWQYCLRLVRSGSWFYFRYTKKILKFIYSCIKYELRIFLKMFRPFRTACFLPQMCVHRAVDLSPCCHNVIWCQTRILFGRVSCPSYKINCEISSSVTSGHETSCHVWST